MHKSTNLIIVKIVTGIRREDRRSFRDQRTNEHKEMHAV